MKRIWGKKLPLTAAPSGVRFLRSRFQLFSPPTHARAAGTLNLERTHSDLVIQAYGLTSAEIDLMWQTAPPRMPIPPPAG